MASHRERSAATTQRKSFLNRILLLRHLGYKVLNGDGSRRKFHHAEKDHMINLHEPHPGNEVKPYAIDQVREKLEEIGLI